MSTKPVRPHSLLTFDTLESKPSQGWNAWRARGKTFVVEWLEAASPSAILECDSSDEVIIVLPFAEGEIGHDGAVSTVPARSVAVIPAGTFTLAMTEGSVAIVLSPLRDRQASATLNDCDYSDGDDGIRALGNPIPRSGDGGLQIIPLDSITPPPGKPRLKMVQSACMSINWIEYEGPRDRSALSPHSHEDFEQGSLAIAGSFLHHLRTPWGADADAWHPDLHLEAPARSLCIIPPRVIHTTEGVGSGKHILIDIFAPPRADFIDKGWISNSSAYRITR